MTQDKRPWDALSRAAGDDYTYTLHCNNYRPIRCGHSAELDVAATLERVGDRTWDWVREHARCTACGRFGATVIVSPNWTGPADQNPKWKRGQ